MEAAASVTIALPGENAQSIYSCGGKTVEVLSVQLIL